MSEKKQIVFIEFYSLPMIYKTAKLFRKKGYETVLIRILEQNSNDKDFYDKAYDKVIDFKIKHIRDKNIFKIINCQRDRIKSIITSLFLSYNLKPYVVIGRGTPDIPIAFFRILFRNYPFIYFPYDIRNQGDIEFEKKKDYWLEIKAERFLFENSDGILHKGAPEELNLKYMNGRILGNNIKLSRLQLAFHPYCSKEFIIPLNKDKLSKKDNEIHIVSVGGISKQKKEFYEFIFNSYRKIPENKIHIHFYFCYDVNKEFNYKEWELSVKDFMKDSNVLARKYFHIHPPLNPKKVSLEISKYDFGAAGDYNIYKENGIEPLFSIGNKMSSYFEAGIPFIFGKNYKFMKRLAQKYDIAIYWPKSFKNFRKYLKSLDYKKLEKNIVKAREDFSMEKHFPKLMKFVEEVVSSRGSR